MNNTLDKVKPLIESAYKISRDDRIDNLLKAALQLIDEDDGDGYWFDVKEHRPRAGKWVRVKCKNGYTVNAVRIKNTDIYCMRKDTYAVDVIGWHPIYEK